MYIIYFLKKSFLFIKNM